MSNPHRDEEFEAKREDAKRRRREVELQDELQAQKKTNAALQKQLRQMKKGPNKNEPKKGPNINKPKKGLKKNELNEKQQASKIPEPILLATRNYESGVTEVSVLNEQFVELDEEEKRLLANLESNVQTQEPHVILDDEEKRMLENIDSTVCSRCKKLLAEINALEQRMEVPKETENAKLSHGDQITHDYYEKLLKQYVNGLRKLTELHEKKMKLNSKTNSMLMTVADINRVQAQDNDIWDYQDIILFLQDEKEMVGNDMRDTVLTLKDKESEVIELNQNLAQTEEKYKLEYLKQQNVSMDSKCHEEKKTAAQEIKTLHKLIEVTQILSRHLMYQIKKLRKSGDQDILKQLEDICMTTKELHLSDEVMKIEIEKMHMEGIENRKLKAFAKVVVELIKDRADVEQSLLDLLNEHVESNRKKDLVANQLTAHIDDLSEGNETLQNQLTVKVEEMSEMEKEKDMELHALHQSLEKVTLEKTTFQNLIGERDGEIEKLKNKRELKDSTDSVIEPAPYIYELAEKFKQQYGEQVLSDREEVKRLQTVNREQSQEIINLMQKLKICKSTYKRKPEKEEEGEGEKKDEEKDENQDNVK